MNELVHGLLRVPSRVASYGLPPMGYFVRVTFMGCFVRVFSHGLLLYALLSRVTNGLLRTGCFVRVTSNGLFRTGCLQRVAFNGLLHGLLSGYFVRVSLMGCFVRVSFANCLQWVASGLFRMGTFTRCSVRVAFVRVAIIRVTSNGLLRTGCFVGCFDNGM
jgi:hypothetical protein